MLKSEALVLVAQFPDNGFQIFFGNIETPELGKQRKISKLGQLGQTIDSDQNVLFGINRFA